MFQLKTGITVDFYCSALNLAIEIDGGYHSKKRDNDKHRDTILKQIGITTIDSLTKR